MTSQTALDRWLGRAVGPAKVESPSEQPAATLEAPEHKEDVPLERAVLAIKHTCHPNVRYISPEKKHVASLKRLNSLLLPISYPESFYKDIVSDPVSQSITLLAFWHARGLQDENRDDPGQLIGAIRCRLLNHKPLDSSKDGPMLYLSTLVLLSPYRNLGIASEMLNIMLKRAVEDHGVTTVGAHVWEANTQALEWYAKRGFKEVQYEADYYRKLEPHGAKVVRKDISVLDLIHKRG